MVFLGLIVLSYLLGAIPSGVVVGRVARGIDVRDYGSGKTGVANVFRTLGLRASIVVLISDVAKVVVAVLLARLLLDSKAAEVAAALAAVVGHNWSVYIRFQGGRGVIPAAGGLLMMAPLVVLPSLGIALAAMALFRYVSLGSIVGSANVLLLMAMVVAMGWEPWEYLVYAFLGVSLIIFQHRDNIERLLAGTERRLGERGEERGVRAEEPGQRGSS